MTSERRMCLYDFEWQVLRVQLEGSWTTLDGARNNLDMLEAYLWSDTWSIGQKDHVLISRLYRILNYLDAVRMGYHGMGAGDTDKSHLVANYNEVIRDQYTSYQALKDWHGNWEIPSEDSYKEDLAIAGKYWGQKVVESLHKRWIFAMYKAGGRSKARATQIEERVKKSRPELLWALNTLRGLVND